MQLGQGSWVSWFGVFLPFPLLRLIHSQSKGNKGGTAVRLSFTPQQATEDKPDESMFAPTVLTFVNSHLAAFDEMVERRHADFHDLSRRLIFDSSAMDNTEGIGGVRAHESDVLFWMVSSMDTDIRLRS